MTKYRAKPISIDGIRFASTKEGRRYIELKLLARSGLITDLTLQPEFDCLAFGGGKVGKYRADFSYYEGEKLVIEDVKGHRTPLYRWKKKHVERQYKIEIRET